MTQDIDIINDVFHGATAQSSAREGHNTERAEVVATLRDVYESGNTRIANQSFNIVGLAVFELGERLAVAFLGTVFGSKLFDTVGEGSRSIANLNTL